MPAIQSLYIDYFSFNAVRFENIDGYDKTVNTKWINIEIWISEFPSDPLCENALQRIPIVHIERAGLFAYQYKCITLKYV